MPVPARSLPRRLTGAAEDVFRRLPEPWKRRVVRRLTPSHTVGSVVVFRDGDAVLVVRQHHSSGWCLPGGHLRAGESAYAGLRREVVEELGAAVWTAWAPAVPQRPSGVVHDPVARRVDLVFLAAVERGADIVPGDGIDEHRWLSLAEDPENQTTADALQAVDVRRSLPHAG